MKIQILSLSLSLVLFTSLAQALANPNCASEPLNGKDSKNTLKIFNIYAPCSPFKPPTPHSSWEHTLLQTQANDETRLLQLLTSVPTKKAVGPKKSIVPIASGRPIVQNPTYIVKVNIGTPASSMLLALDTSSDTTWIPCLGCNAGCAGRVVFDSGKSSSFKSVGCQADQCKQVPNPTCGGSTCAFNLAYSGSTVAANLSQDTFTLATDPIPNYTFGCITQITGTSVPAQGLLGLSQGPLSFLSQTQSIYKSTFSYCLPNFRSSNFSGSLRLGPIGQPIRIKYTPLLKNPRKPSLYYVNLVGIRVGKKVVDIPPSVLAFNPTTGGGTIIDSGTVYTRLVTPAYIAVRDEFRSRIKANLTTLGGFDTCYSVPIVAPTITFMFTGMNVTLPEDNALIHSSAGSTSCLAMTAAPDILNVIANMQQQNHRILIDVPNSRIGVARERCS